MKRSLKITGCLFVLLLLFQSAGQYLLFVTLQHRAQRQAVRRIARQLPDHQLTLLRIPPADRVHLQYIDRQEVRYHGHYYDIVRTSRQGDTLLLHTLRDDRETELFARWSRQFQRNAAHPGDLPSPGRLFQDFSRLKYLLAAIALPQKAIFFSAPPPHSRCLPREAPLRAPPTPPPRQPGLHFPA